MAAPKGHTLAGLRSAREHAFLSQAELAEKAGFHQRTISDLECNRNSGRMATVRRLAEVLGVKPEELIAEPAA
jgi:transcriptional regulator with XRE-family HTH domain